MKTTYDAEKRSVTVNGRLRVQVQIVDEATGEPLFVVDEVALDPGDTLSWTYPAEGLKITMTR